MEVQTAVIHWHCCPQNVM